jgi:hypothetical protein
MTRLGKNAVFSVDHLISVLIGAMTVAVFVLLMQLGSMLLGGTTVPLADVDSYDAFSTSAESHIGVVRQ